MSIYSSALLASLTCFGVTKFLITALNTAACVSCGVDKKMSKSALQLRVFLLFRCLV